MEYKGQLSTITLNEVVRKNLLRPRTLIIFLIWIGLTYAFIAGAFYLLASYRDPDYWGILRFIFRNSYPIILVIAPLYYGLVFILVNLYYRSLKSKITYHLIFGEKDMVDKMANHVYQDFYQQVVSIRQTDTTIYLVWRKKKGPKMWPSKETLMLSKDNFQADDKERAYEYLKTRIRHHRPI